MAESGACPIIEAFAFQILNVEPRSPGLGIQYLFLSDSDGEA